MPDKGLLIGFAERSKRQCREQLRQEIGTAVDELLHAGCEPEVIAEALLELADDYMDTVINGSAMQVPPRRTH
ncbi:hypothetical protein [Rhizobium sp. P28RR-XV]|uniref:hypothetical protein n=1 Tax=Rhizobium sp. P28RR-XV TaxID=2726737 RepID=UPI00145646E0|nr:hypothetical protein [Rhizobium sp. P28RR-XV]NLR85451.1 hypothetical protein [Rhizobium sp. P28RR-XV]